jgi:putative methionine-R-sulfoxide reductase with GAF domain
MRASGGLVDKKIGSEKKDKPVLNEDLLGKLLEAAYVLQEHNRRTRGMELSVELDERERETKTAPVETSAAQASTGKESTPSPTIAPPVQDQAPAADYTLILAQIVETQHKIQLHNLKLEEAMTVVTERVREFARASGSAIATVNGKRIRYRAASGAMALTVGTEVVVEKALCSACVRTGQVIRGANINAEFLLDSGECQRRGIQSMIAVPVYHQGGIAGALELYYAGGQTFTEEDVHTCQLMAGLVTEALARDEKITWKQSLANERAVVREALEKPNSTRTMFQDDDTGQKAVAGHSALTYPAFSCRRCGHQLVGEEKFCGKCGTARSVEQSTPDLQPKPALADSIAQVVPELFAASTGTPGGLTGAIVRRPVEIADHSLNSAYPNSAHVPVELVADGTGLEEEDDAAPETSLSPAADWSSAASARAFLHQLAAGKPDDFTRFWRAHRGDIYLAVAAVLVAVVIGWGVFSDHSVGAAANPASAGHRMAPEAELSVLDRMLISLGLAEAPQPPESKGNPDTQVWVDLHTALYYCPGADLYGKTPKGKFATQHDAQLDQFEPAYRKACE